MSTVVLAQAQPRNAAGAAVDVRLAGGGTKAFFQLGFSDWRDGIANLPRFTSALGFEQAGFTGGALPQTGALRFFPSDKALLSSLGAMAWKGAPITITTGDDEAFAPTYAAVFVGRVADHKITAGALVLTLSDMSSDLAKAACPDSFAGTGGLEGGNEAIGRLKRRTWGYAFNIEGRVLDKVNSIYEFGDPNRPVSALPAVKDKGRVASSYVDVAWAGSAAATLAALIAATAPAGGCARAPSINCVKWWTTPAGPLTADVKGEVGSGYVETAPEIAARVVSVYSTAITIGNLSAALGWQSAQAGVHCGDANETVGDLLDRLLIPVSTAWLLGGDAVLSFRQLTWGASVETITAETIERLDVFQPLRTRHLGFQRNYRQHSDAEISAAVLAADLAGQVDFLSQVGGAEKPANNATRNQVTYSTTAPASPVNGDIWVDLNGTYAVFKLRNAGVWQIGANALTAYNALAGTPVALADINTTESAKLAGVDANATNSDNTIVNAGLATNSVPWSLFGGIVRYAGSASDPAPGYFFFPASVESYAWANGAALTRLDGAKKVFVSGKVYANGTLAGQAYAIIYWRKADGSAASVAQTNTSVVPATTGSWQDFSFTVTPPADAAFYYFGAYGNGNANGFSMCGFRVASTEIAADVTPPLVTGPTVTTIAYDYTGAAKAGQLPVDIVFKAKNAAGTDITTAAAWTPVLKTGTASFTIGAATGILNVTAVSSDATIEVTATYAGKAGKATTALQRAVDTPPASTGGGGSGGGGAGSSDSTTTISQTTSTSYGSANTRVLTVKASASGTINLACPAEFKRTTVGTNGARGKWQKSPAGAGTWSDVATEVSSSADANRVGGSEPSNDPGTIAVSQSATGLTSGSDYDFQLFLRNTDTGTCNVTSTAGASAVAA